MMLTRTRTVTEFTDGETERFQNYVFHLLIENARERNYSNICQETVQEECGFWNRDTDDIWFDFAKHVASRPDREQFTLATDSCGKPVFWLRKNIRNYLP